MSNWPATKLASHACVVRCAKDALGANGRRLLWQDVSVSASQNVRRAYLKALVESLDVPTMDELQEVLRDESINAQDRADALVRAIARLICLHCISLSHNAQLA